MQPFYDELNAHEFKGRVSVPITWGKMPSSRRRRRSIRFGSYSSEDKLIRVHPALDQAFVPAFFVRYIVFHEMLHAYFDATDTDGKRAHSAEFRKRERAYSDYARAVAWQANASNLRKVLGPISGDR